MSEFGKDINVHSRKGVFIPYITVEMFRNAPLEGVEELMANGEMEDISLSSAQPSSSCVHENDSISRQAAIDAFEDTTFTKNEIQRRLSDLPSAKPEIIYCGECKHMLPNGRCLAFADLSIRPMASDYCSKAERRTDEQAD